MKKIFLLIILGFGCNFILAQDVIGTWNGVLKIQGIELRIVFHIDKNAGTYTATLDSPDQGAKGIPVTAVTLENDSLKLDIKTIYGKYEGKIESENKITGNFSQMGATMPLDLVKGTGEEKKVSRPQEPKPPFPYYSEEVKFVNKIDGDTLAGTLTLPKKEGKFPVVIIITGSGPQNRDEELMGHKPFLVIADYLTRNGIGVLRYDDRGTAQSTGDFKKATSYDFSKDVEAAINYLITRKDVNKKKIGLIGHSEGGIIAPMVAARNKNVAFIVLLAGTVVRGDKLLLMQAEAIGKVSGMSDEDLRKTKETNSGAYDLVLNSTDREKLKSDLKAYLKKAMEENVDTGKTISQEQKETQITMMIELLSSPWMQYFIQYDPVSALEKIKIPVLALNGSKDLQVPAKENLPAITEALYKAGNKNFKTVELEGLNHLFQECKTGSPQEYAKIKQTFSSKALDEILNWIKIQIGSFSLVIP